MLEKREADVIIIGGGIMGCATAYRLAKQGVDVLVLEKKEIGNGGSCRNAGGVRQSARDPKELPLAMYAVANIWPHLSEELKPYIYALPVEVSFLNNETIKFNQKITEYVRKNSRNSSIPESKDADKS